MQTLTYGLKKPESGDRGSIFFPALEDNITQLDGHSHNGVDSPQLTSVSIAYTTQNILAGSWVLQSPGTYRQLVTMPSGLLYDQKVPTFRITSSGDLVNLTVEKVSSDSFYVYISDNTLGITIHYL